MRRLALWALAVFAILPAHAGWVIREGDSWNYWKGLSTPAAGWTNLVFDESGWSNGIGGFGYGDSQDNTVLTDMSNAYATVYLRKSFVIADTGAVSTLTLAVDFNDGFVAYLNGQELYRSNLPVGALTHQTLATRTNLASRNSNGSERIFFPLSPGLLQPGSNLLALSGHNVRTNSRDFTLLVELFTNITLVRGPILSLQRDRRVTVLWRTEVLSDSVVEYGLTPSYEGGTISNGAAVRQHVIELPELPAGSSVYYRIRSAGVALATNVFRSPPAPGQPFRFAVIGDFGTRFNNTRDVAQRVAMQNVDLLLTVGDNVYNYGQPGSYDNSWFTPYSQTLARAVLMPVMGDHDTYSAGGAWFTNNLALPTNGPAGFIERCYAFNYGDVHFTAIDNNPFNPGNNAQMTAITNWVFQDLAAATQRWKIAYLHYPPFTSWGDHDEDTNTRNRLVPVLERWGVHLVFQGDNHWYERINTRNGVNYFTAGGGGAALAATINSRMPYSAAVSNEVHSFILGEVSGSVCRVRGMDKNGVIMDEYRYDLDHPFVLDGLLDSTNWIRVTNGLTFHAAIRSNFLYVAAQDAGEGSDHFIYLADRLSTNRPANWNKNALAMNWRVFLADENDNGEHGWYDADDRRMTDLSVARSMTFGVTNNLVSTNGHLEGTLDLFTIFTNFPQRLYAAVVPFQTASGGLLVTSGQAPPPMTGPGNSGSNVDSNEFYEFATRSVALDLPIAHAGSNVAAEAGAWTTLDGSGSSAPSGYPLSFVWSQISGPTGVLAGSSFATTVDVPAPTNAEIRLVVNDLRFDATATVTVTVTPLLDSDGDGLSDQEELTGADNLVTPANPNGQLSNPFLADTDGDGMNDGDEALAGTDPASSASVFRWSDVEPVATSLVLTWRSASNRHYDVMAAPQAGLIATLVASNLPGVPPMNSVTVPVTDAERIFFLRTRP